MAAEELVTSASPRPKTRQAASKGQKPSSHGMAAKETAQQRSPPTMRGFLPMRSEVRPMSGLESMVTTICAAQSRNNFV